MASKKKISITLLSAAGILSTIAYVSWSKKTIFYLPSQHVSAANNTLSTTLAHPTNPGWSIYKDKEHGLELQYPEQWLSYGDKNEFSNPDLLSWRGFIPDYDSQKSYEEQGLIQVSVWNKNADSPFRPSSLIKHTNANELWKTETVNSYQATRITNPKLPTTKTYVFERDGKLYVIDASESVQLDKILSTVKFF
jgi:hypothetical protein